MGQRARGLLLAEGHPDQADLDRKEAGVLCNAGSLVASHCLTPCPHPWALLAGLDEVSAEPGVLTEFALPFPAGSAKGYRSHRTVRIIVSECVLMSSPLELPALHWLTGPLWASREPETGHHSWPHLPKSGSRLWEKGWGQGMRVPLLNMGRHSGCWRSSMWRSQRIWIHSPFLSQGASTENDPGLLENAYKLQKWPPPG